jgi:diguanylate cyclase (GGDEF)-like protein/PAS domain S-box-containing protein
VSRAARAVHALLAPFTSLHWPLALTGALLLSLAWGTVLWESQRIEDDHMAKYRTELSHLTEVFDEMMARQLHSIDGALLILRAEYADHPSDLRRMVNILRRDALRGDAVHVTVIGRNGQVEFTDPPIEQSPPHLGDRDHFRHFANGAQDALYIGTPLFGRMNKHWYIPLARPILGKDGKFMGVMVILMPPAQLTRFMQSLDIADDTVVTLVSDGGTILSRSRDMNSHLGKTLPPEQMAGMRRYAHGQAEHVIVPDPGQQTNAHHWIHDYPLLLMVSRAPDATHAEISVLQRQMAVMGAGASLVIIVSLFLLGMALQQRRRAQESLEQEHQSLLEAQRIAQLGNWSLSVASGRLSWSDEVARILEVDSGASPGGIQAYLERVHPQDREAVGRAFTASLTQTGPSSIAHRLIAGNGRIKWVRAQWVHDFDAAGRAVRASGTLQDITARKHEEAEREALDRQRLLLLESTGEGIYGVDAEGTCTFINQAAARMLGYGVDEIIGAKVHPLIHHHHADGSVYPADDCHAIRVTLTGKACHIDHEVFWRKDGTFFPVEYAANPIRDGERITGSVVTFSDITQRKHAETELRIAEKAFQTQEGMFVTDAEGTIVRINDAFTEITGYRAEDVVGKNPRFRSSGRHDAAFYAAMWDTIAKQGFWRGEIWNRRKSGDIYPEAVTVTAVRDDKGHVTHYVGNLHDITQRKLQEEEIRSLAFYDPLTQLPNRRLLAERLQHALIASDRSRRWGALLFIDLDKFKLLNDTLGHDIGDLLLQQVAQRLLACVREADTVARIGGDEFVVLLEQISVQERDARHQTEQIGQKIIQALNQPYELAGHRHLSTPSIGASLFCGKVLGGDELLKRADLAMYHAKASGRNALCFFDPEMLNVHPDGPRTLTAPL